MFPNFDGILGAITLAPLNRLSCGDTFVPPFVSNVTVYVATGIALHLA